METTSVFSIHSPILAPFPCHGLNGHNNAYIYWSESLEAAAFLGHLIPHQDLELGFLPGPAKAALKKGYHVDGLNQVATYLFRPREF